MFPHVRGHKKTKDKTIHVITIKFPNYLKRKQYQHSIYREINECIFQTCIS